MAVRGRACRGRAHRSWRDTGTSVDCAGLAGDFARCTDGVESQIGAIPDAVFPRTVGHFHASLSTKTLPAQPGCALGVSCAGGTSGEARDAFDTSAGKVKATSAPS